MATSGPPPPARQEQSPPGQPPPRHAPQTLCWQQAQVGHQRLRIGTQGREGVVREQATTAKLHGAYAAHSTSYDIINRQTSKSQQGLTNKTQAWPYVLPVRFCIRTAREEPTSMGSPREVPAVCRGRATLNGHQRLGGQQPVMSRRGTNYTATLQGNKKDGSVPAGPVIPGSP